MGLRIGNWMPVKVKDRTVVRAPRMALLTIALWRFVCGLPQLTKLTIKGANEGNTPGIDKQTPSYKRLKDNNLEFYWQC